jgi:plasmid stability protein
MSNDVQVLIRTSPELRDRLRLRANQRGISVAELTRELWEDELADERDIVRSRLAGLGCRLSPRPATDLDRIEQIRESYRGLGPGTAEHLVNDGRGA